MCVCVFYTLNNWMCINDSFGLCVIKNSTIYQWARLRFVIIKDIILAFKAITHPNNPSLR